jgi:hypothetical protein
LNNRVRMIDAKTGLIHTIAGDGTTAETGDIGDDGPALQASFTGPAGVALMPEPDGKVTVFVADYYSGHVRAVGPDGIIRDLSDEGAEAFGAPTRVAYAVKGPRRGWLYVADSSKDQIVPVNIPRLAPPLGPPKRLLPFKRPG